MLGIWRA
jgi:hypothetical protein